MKYQEKTFATHEEFESWLLKHPESKRVYDSWEPWKRAHLEEFLMAKRSLPVLHNHIFKQIFNPDIYSDRVSDLVSCLIGEKVTVKAILPSEDYIAAHERMVIMDIIVELEDGSIANVEVQKNPYLFPGERISCYSADLIARQYTRVKGERGKKFQYGDLKKVYVIVLFEKTTAQFKHYGEVYIHRGRMQFDTGLDLEMLEQVIVKYPWLLPIYEELALLRSNPEGVIDMYSEILAQIDENTMQYMIDIQQAKIEAQEAELEANQAEIEANQEEIKTTKAEIKATKAELETSKAELEASKAEIERLKKLLADKS